jgi:undecaprenyl-diphosphatase
LLIVWGNSFARGVTMVAAAAVLLAAGIATAFKYTVRRNRPWDQPQFYAVKHDRYSFPSGHATRMVAIATVLAHFVPSAAIAGYLLAMFVAICRVLVGVHYVSDVVVGTLIGLASAGFMLALL